MLNYLDLTDLKTKAITDEKGNEIITKVTSITITENMSINEITLISKEAVKSILEDLNPNKIYNFVFDIVPEELSEEVFETVINILVAEFFKGIRISQGRQRERRLDVPNELKQNVYCNMSLLKNAINYNTLIDKFQLEIVNQELIYIMVGNK